MNQMHGLVPVTMVSPSQRAEIFTLIELCNRHDHLDLALNLEPDNQTVNQFLFYQNGHLAGFASIDGFMPDLEVCGMVHPDDRRNGIGRILLAAVTEECRRRGASHLQLICETGSAAGRALALAHGATLKQAEHRMWLDPAAHKPRAVSPDRLTIRPAGPADTDAIARVAMASFGDTEAESRQFVAEFMPRADQQYYLAELPEEPVGIVRVSRAEPPRAYLTTLGVVLDHQGRGYGRRLIERSIADLLADGQNDIWIEVLTDNYNALGLYRSCGFHETTTFEFYELNFAPQTLV